MTCEGRDDGGGEAVGGDLKAALREFADAAEGAFDEVLEMITADRGRATPGTETRPPIPR
jgi:hypothetical protein